MKAETFRRHVPGTVMQAMAVLLDVEQWPAWRPGLRIVHLSDRPVRSGSIWLDKRPLGRRDVKFTARAVEVEPPRVFAYTLTGGGLEAFVRWTVRQDDERVLVVQHVEVRSIGLRGLVTDARRQFLANQHAAMDRLRHLLGRSPEGGA
ncbi:MAG: SRPBCC family protein [Thermoplasmatota archaeon]